MGSWVDAGSGGRARVEGCKGAADGAAAQHTTARAASACVARSPSSSPMTLPSPSSSPLSLFTPLSHHRSPLLSPCPSPSPLRTLDEDAADAAEGLTGERQWGMAGICGAPATMGAEAGVAGGCAPMRWSAASVSMPSLRAAPWEGDGLAASAWLPGCGGRWTPGGAAAWLARDESERWPTNGEWAVGERSARRGAARGGTGTSGATGTANEGGPAVGGKRPATGGGASAGAGWRELAREAEGRGGLWGPRAREVSGAKRGVRGRGRDGSWGGDESGAGSVGGDWAEDVAEGEAEEGRGREKKAKGGRAVGTGEGARLGESSSGADRGVENAGGGGASLERELQEWLGAAVPCAAKRGSSGAGEQPPGTAARADASRAATSGEGASTSGGGVGGDGMAAEQRQAGVSGYGGGNGGTWDEQQEGAGVAAQQVEFRVTAQEQGRRPAAWKPEAKPRQSRQSGSVFGSGEDGLTLESFLRGGRRARARLRGQGAQTWQVDDVAARGVAQSMKAQQVQGGRNGEAEGEEEAEGEGKRDGGGRREMVVELRCCADQRLGHQGGGQGVHEQLQQWRGQRSLCGGAGKGTASHGAGQVHRRGRWDELDVSAAVAALGGAGEAGGRGKERCGGGQEGRGGGGGGEWEGSGARQGGDGVGGGSSVRAGAVQVDGSASPAAPTHALAAPALAAPATAAGMAGVAGVLCWSPPWVAAARGARAVRGSLDVAAAVAALGGTEGLEGGVGEGGAGRDVCMEGVDGGGGGGIGAQGKEMEQEREGGREREAHAMLVEEKRTEKCEEGEQSMGGDGMCGMGGVSAEAAAVHAGRPPSTPPPCTPPHAPPSPPLTATSPASQRPSSPPRPPQGAQAASSGGRGAWEWAGKAAQPQEASSGRAEGALEGGGGGQLAEAGARQGDGGAAVGGGRWKGRGGGRRQHGSVGEVERAFEVAPAHLLALHRWHPSSRDLAVRWAGWLLRRMRKAACPPAPRPLRLLLFSALLSALPRLADSLLSLASPPPASPCHAHSQLLHSAASLLRAVERSRTALPALQWAALQELLPRCHSLLAAAASLHRRTRHGGSVAPHAPAAAAVGLGGGGGAAASTAVPGAAVCSPPHSSSSASPASSAATHATAVLDGAAERGACGGGSGGGSSMDEDGAGRHTGRVEQGSGTRAAGGRVEGSEDESRRGGCERRAGEGWAAPSAAAVAASADVDDACVPVAMASGAHDHARPQPQHTQQHVAAQGNAVGGGALPDTVHALPACTPSQPLDATAPAFSFSSHPAATHALVCVQAPPTLQDAQCDPHTEATPCGAATRQETTVPSFPRFSPFAAAATSPHAAGTPLHVLWAARAAGHRVSRSMDGSSDVASGLSGGARQQFVESRRRQQQAVQACVQALQGGLFSPYGRSAHTAGHAGTSRWRGAAAENGVGRGMGGSGGEGREQAEEEGRRGEGLQEREGNGGARVGGGWEWGGREGGAGGGEGGKGHERSHSLDVDAMAQLCRPLHHAAASPHGAAAGLANGGSERWRRGTGAHHIDPTAPAAASPHAYSPLLPPKSPSPQPKGRFPPFPHDATPSPHPPLAHAHHLSKPPFQPTISPHPAAATWPCAAPSSPGAPHAPLSAHPPTLEAEGVGAAEERAVEEMTSLFSAHFSAPSAPAHRPVCAAPHGATQAQPTPDGTKGCARRTPHPALAGCAAPQAVHATLNAASHPPPCSAAARPPNATGAADSVEFQSTGPEGAGEASPAHETGMAAGGGMGAAVPPKPRSRKKMMSRREWL
ncbi:unnamed protein product [Closterium sp. Naga37s-1]|nr:unnamed protein product [Closterium sp. Naga37s-1]